VADTAASAGKAIVEDSAAARAEEAGHVDDQD
jgi:hypothetical protein